MTLAEQRPPLPQAGEGRRSRRLAQAGEGSRRRGFTLVELLVVVSIIVMLTVFALPVITPSVESRRIREAARAVNVYLGSARNRAMETGRPCGVLFQRTPGLNQATMTLYMAQVPPPYAGDQVDSKVRMQVTGPLADGRLGCRAAALGGYDSQLVSVGDLMQVNGQGPMYEIISPGTLTLAVDLRNGGSVPWPQDNSWSAPVSYQIFRSPVPTMAAPLPLPSTVVVDMAFSGLGTVDSGRMQRFRPINNNDALPVMVIFSPRGDVDAVYCRDSSGTFGGWPVSEPLYLLIGKQQRVPATVGGPSPAEDGLHNWRDPSNLWVTLNPQTGLIKTVEVRAAGDLRESRRIAQGGQSMGGK